MERMVSDKIKIAELEQIQEPQQTSFNVGCYKNQYFTRPWHFHPEYELLLITHGSGTRMVGDCFEEFNSGDLVLLGSNLPHAWISDSSYMKTNNTKTCQSVYVQFRKSVFGTHFIDVPEMVGVRNVLNKAEYGLKIEGPNSDKIRNELIKMQKQSSMEQLLSLIRMLDLIPQTNYKTLASNSFLKQQVHFKSNRMNKLHQFIMQNFKNELNIDHCSQFLNMTPSSFCRFFKNQTNVTFSVYLNYIRINLAQKLLRNTNLPIKEVGYECGFNSIVYFNQKFKDLTGITPGQYRLK